MRRVLLFLVVLCGVIVVPVAAASQVISTSTVTGLTLGVNSKGEAMVSYRAGGKRCTSSPTAP